MGKIITITNYDLMCRVEDQLRKRLTSAEEVEVLNYNGTKIFFDVKQNGEWYIGFVKVADNTDLGVYIQKNPDVVDYSYQFDILWCDILPEEDED